MAWGRIADIQEDIVKGLKTKSEGGTGNAKIFLQYCDQETKNFL
jgi:retinol dehydrogenase-12